MKELTVTHVLFIKMLHNRTLSFANLSWPTLPVLSPSIQSLLELGKGVLENANSFSSVIAKILRSTHELISCQACRVLVVDIDPPGVRINSECVWEVKWVED